MPPVDRPLFIIGPPRAGSTYLVRLLDGHPDVTLTNETRILTWAWRALNPGRPGGEQPRWAPLWRGDRILGYMEYRMGGLIADCYRDVLGADGWWGDKFPHYADPHEGVLEMAHGWWPEAAWVALVRDPAAVARSIRARNKLDGGPSEARYRDAEAIARSHTDRALRWVERDDVDGLAVTYDGLKAEPAGIVRRILEWWGPGLWDGLDRHVAQASTKRWSHPTSW